MAQYTIREISEMFQLPSSTLRYYEDMEILTNIKRNNSGQRIYEDCHVNRLRTICCFKNAGMSISQLKEFHQPLPQWKDYKFKTFADDFND